MKKAVKIKSKLAENGFKVTLGVDVKETNYEVKVSW